MKLLKLFILSSALLSCATAETPNIFMKHVAPQNTEGYSSTDKIKSNRIKLSLDLFRIAREENKMILFYFFDKNVDLSVRMNKVVSSDFIKNILDDKYITVYVDVNKNPEMLDMLLKSQQVPVFLIVKVNRVMSFREEYGFFGRKDLTEILNNPFDVL